MLCRSNLDAGKPLYAPEVVSLIRLTEGISHSSRSRPCGATDAMNIVLRLIGQIVIYDMGYIIYINAPRRNIRGHQHLDAPRFEILHCSGTLHLGLIAVNGGSPDIALAQLQGHLVCAVLGACEDQDRLGVGVFQQGEQQRRTAVERDGNTASLSSAPR